MNNFKDIAGSEKNFCRVFRVPSKFPGATRAHTYTREVSASFEILDWFDPIPYPDDGFDVRTESGDLDFEKVRELTRNFLQKKVYFRAGDTLLVITDYGDAFLVEKQGKSR